MFNTRQIKKQMANLKLEATKVVAKLIDSNEEWIVFKCVVGRLSPHHQIHHCSLLLLILAGSGRSCGLVATFLGTGFIASAVATTVAIATGIAAMTILATFTTATTTVLAAFTAATTTVLTAFTAATTTVLTAFATALTALVVTLGASFDGRLRVVEHSLRHPA